jgi:hypothetical protein
MSSPRPRKDSDSKSSACLIFECLGGCLSAVAAADEETKAKEAHNRHDHRDEQRHYNNAARYHHNSGNHYAELRADANAHEAGHEARRESGCSIM